MIKVATCSAVIDAPEITGSTTKCKYVYIWKYFVY